MEIQELYATASGSLLVLFLGWQIARVGDTFWRHCAQLIRKYLLQTLIVTRRAGSSDYTVGVGLAVTLLLAGNVTAVCLQARDLRDVTERVRDLFHVNLIPLYMGARSPVLAEMAFGLTLEHHGLMHRCLGWICLIEGLGYALLSLASEQWTVRSYNFGVMRLELVS